MIEELDETTARFDIQELVLGWRRLNGEPPRLRLTTRVGLKSDLGCVRDNNEDKAEFYEPIDPPTLAARGSVYCVADGMGGHAAGQIASELAVKSAIAAYYSDMDNTPDVAMVQAVRQANDTVREAAIEAPERAGMGTTFTALALVQGHALVTHLGDSRAYLLRDGELRQITTDHTWVEEQVQNGVMTRAQAESSPYRNIITRCIGTEPTIDVDSFAVDTRTGDIWLLCSDGLTGHVEDDEIQSIIDGAGPSEACRQLITLACARGGSDNVTALIVKIEDMETVEVAA